ncbi:hypothetical protein QFN52_004449, partial [Escherichia coli]|nr:hypothetical protein [Escherichia coli]
MQKTPFNKITITLRRQHWVFFALVPIVTVLTVGMFWGLQRAVEQEQRRFTLDFSTLIGYVDEQEKFLYQLQQQNMLLPSIPLTHMGSLRRISKSTILNYHIFEGQESSVDMPFSLSCQGKSDCQEIPGNLYAFGSYLSDFYSSFWASSYFPAAAVFLVNDGNSVSISVPAINTKAGYEPISVQTYIQATNGIREKIKSDARLKCTNQNSNLKAVWFRIPSMPNQLVALIPAKFSVSIWKNNSTISNCMYTATLLNRERIGVLERAVNPAPKHIFWLQYGDRAWIWHKEHGVLIGEGKVPELLNPGLHYTLNGIVLKVSDKSSAWEGVYLIHYSSFFMDNYWLPLITILMLFFSVFGFVLYMRWYEQRVIKPANEAQRSLIESVEFNRTLIQTAPVALCLISRKDGHFFFYNTLASQWLGITQQESCQNPYPDFIGDLLKIVQHANQEGNIDRFHIPGNKTLSVAYAPTRYMQQDCTLCAFTDVSSHAEIERSLAQAKSAADEANEAKSTFLATMSHEIRT